MNLFTLITVVLVINLFLEDSFLTYGYDVCKYFENINGQVNPMEYLFPKMATCSYRAYGRSGSRENFSRIFRLIIFIAPPKKVFFVTKNVDVTRILRLTCGSYLGEIVIGEWQKFCRIVDLGQLKTTFLPR